MRCKTDDGYEVYYEVQGNSVATQTVVFLNGLTQSTLSWGLMTPYFSKSRIILLDFIFQGQSDKHAGWRDFDRHARDVMAVMEKENCCPVNVVGLSYGSLVAQHFALLFPACTRKLVLMSTFAAKTPHYEATETAWWHALEKGGYSLMFDVMLPFILSEDYFSNPVIPMDAIKAMRKDANQNATAVLNLMRATRERGDYRNELRGIRCPTLVIQGEKDLLFPVPMAREVQAAIPDAKLAIIKNAGHTLNLERVPEVARAITDFLQ